MSEKDPKDPGREGPLQAAMPRDNAPPAFHDAVAAVFERHHDRVFRVAHRITGNASDAEDVLQTVFLRLLRREEPIELGDDAGSYLHRAAVNAALDMLRRRKSARIAPLEEAQHEHDAEPGPLDRHEERELRERLRKSLAALPPRTAEMFALRYFEGYGNREIARMLGTTWSVVAVTLHRTRARIQKEILGGHR